jgi:chemotaxis protein methyltransferase CheR
MTVQFDGSEVERFRSFIAQRFGLFFEDQRRDFLAEVLRQRMERTACDRFASYELRFLSAPSDTKEEQALAEQLTICETYFFRYADQFRALVDTVIPDLVRASSHRRVLRILCAGCASGEEAYSLAILIRDRFPELASWEITIQGIDINASMLRKATRALYGRWSLRETTSDIIARYFHAGGRDWLLDHAVSSMVTFEERNLVDEDAVFWRRDAFDIVFCRNVTMYFTPQAVRSLIARIATSLTAGGFLFLGHAETLRGISTEFQLRHISDTFCYQRVVGDKAPSAAAVEPDESWFDIIQRSSKRIKTVTERNSTAVAPVIGASPLLPWDRAPAFELLQSERFAEALEYLRTFPPEARADSDAQLLLAVLLMNTGDMPEAEQVCQRLLELNDLNANAHYFMALCREHAGDANVALEHDQTAVHLDSEFAMPHLHMGLAAKRAAALETAEREFERAWILLAREDTLRILLFGGGFSREALVEFCRIELRICKV